MITLEHVITVTFEMNGVIFGQDETGLFNHYDELESLSANKVTEDIFDLNNNKEGKELK